MSKYSIDSTTLTSIGNAIRAKDGTSAPIQVSDFATRINAIPSGGGGGSTPSYGICPIAEPLTQNYTNITRATYNVTVHGFSATDFATKAGIYIPSEDLTGYSVYTLLLILLSNEAYSEFDSVVASNVNASLVKTLTPVTVGTRTLLGYVFTINENKGSAGWDSNLYSSNNMAAISFNVSSITGGTMIFANLPIIATSSALNNLTLKGVTVAAGATTTTTEFNTIIKAMVTNKPLPVYFAIAPSTNTPLYSNDNYESSLIYYKTAGSLTQAGRCTYQPCMNLHDLRDNILKETSAKINNSTTDNVYFYFASF